MSGRPATHPAPAASLASSDADLVLRVQRGDLEAFEAIYRTYYEFLVTFAMGYVGSSEVARDIVSDIFFKVWSQRESWAPTSVRTYLCGAVRNRALNELRNDRNRSAVSELAVATEERVPGMGQSERPIDDQLEHQEQVAVMWRVIERLPANQREVMMLRWRRHLDFSDIAQIMGITRAAVHMHLSRGIKAVRERWPDSTS